MLDEIKIENFMSLKNISLKLDKVNVLVGPNASGKSKF